MVDFTKPVNNADMVKGLNALIRCNMELCSYYDEDLTPRIKDQAYQQPLASLKALHSYHAELIGDTVRLLGGAPDLAAGEHASVGGRWLRKFAGKGKLNDFVKAEEKLLERYHESLQDQAVRASPECVAVINQVLADSRAALNGLRDAVDSEGGEI